MIRVKSKKKAWLNAFKVNEEVLKEMYEELKGRLKIHFLGRNKEVNKQFNRKMNGNIKGKESC